MENYLTHIINNIDIINTDLKKIINREVKIPYLDDYNDINDYWYPHPPCLIPLFLGYGASSYKGVINHFFCDRKNTFVEFYLEHGFITEIARNSEQWITLLVLKMIMIKEDVTKEIIDFCKKVNYTNYDKVDAFTMEYGDDPNEFEKLVFFNKNLPLKYINSISEYSGDFPSSLKAINNNQINNASIFEIAVPEKLDVVIYQYGLKKIFLKRIYLINFLQIIN